MERLDKDEGCQPAPGEVDLSISRRRIAQGALWLAPAILVATAIPAAAASGISVGDFALNGACDISTGGFLDPLAPGFRLTAGTSPLPAGTQIALTSASILDLGVWISSGIGIDAGALSGSTRTITLQAPLATQTAVAIRPSSFLSVGTTIVATVILPTGYAAGPNAKANASVQYTLVLGALGVCNPA